MRPDPYLELFCHDVRLGHDVLLGIVRAQTEIAKLGLDLGAVMRLAARSVADLTHADGASIQFVDGNDLVCRAASGIVEEHLGFRLKRSASLAGVCIANDEMTLAPDCERDARVDRVLCREAGVRSALVTPLKHGGATIGVLSLAARTPHAFEASDAKVCELMSELIAAAMFHAARYEASELYQLATRDSLTGLPNRALFFDRLRQSIDRACRSQSRLGILNLDLDGLKPINDNFGHRAGDAAIREAGQRMLAVARKTDLVARVGGDEFAIILPHLESRAAADGLCRRLEEKMAQPFEFEGRRLDLGVSSGCALLPEDGEDINILIERADQAMYRVKRLRHRLRA